ncbi:sporulation histidine kinase inhibitor Sda [Paenibacillus sp. HW567]|uniref:sporulation histidine kinase inhibitor Sda n=1 Tax=Paenibacillus sp. HW567 TaxID=1034769 RepID=UPI00036FA32D|nr:sporulation histidine kinase inhibitor Sda [Paenibacillus sp. HW567]
MDYYFHPSPRPSSLELLSDEQLLNIYELAVEANASPDFIEIIQTVLTGRKLNGTDHLDA